MAGDPPRKLPSLTPRPLVDPIELDRPGAPAAKPGGGRLAPLGGVGPGGGSGLGAGGGGGPGGGPGAGGGGGGAGGGGPRGPGPTGAVPPGGWRSVQIITQADGGFLYWLAKLYVFGVLAAAGLALTIAAGIYLVFAFTVPRVPDLATYHQQAAATTVLRGWDGTPLAEWAKERREILPFEAFPKPLVRAFLAAEDRRFFEHSGLDYRGIGRAVLANLRAGGVAQGGSTITQQVAKSFLTSERTIQRKIREAILARRLEARHSKNEILTLYLNQIFLGHGAYGVAAAARRYFDKAVRDLDLGEMAMLAGLARAPSRFSPLTSLEAARARRDQVLTAMVAAGFLGEPEANAWRARPLIVRPRPDFFHEVSPYFAEHVRRDIAKRYGEKRLYEGGVEIETTLVPWIDSSAQDNVDFSLRKLDKRQGWRGPVARLLPAAAAEFKRRAVVRYGSEPPQEGRLYLGLVESVTPAGARVRIGTGVYNLPAAAMAWAFPYSAKDATNARPLQSIGGILRTGDVVWVRSAHRSRLRRFADWSYDALGEVMWMAPFEGRRPPKGGPDLALEQTPRVQGAILSYDHDSGYVLAMVGGEDFDRSEFNRVTQACRQPGSTYKPVYYSLALDKGFGYGSLLNDVPRAEVDPVTGEVWTPTNLNNTVEYQVTLEYALVWSKNVPSVQIYKLAGGTPQSVEMNGRRVTLYPDVEAWARRLGITTRIIADQALALGASCTRIDELTRAFSVFARNGVLSDPVVLRRVRDRDGTVLEDRTVVSDPWGSPSERLDRLVALGGKVVAPVIPPKAAWLTSQLLRRVVTKGHAPSIRSAGLLAAGKTGTSSATMDTWFVGYTSRWMTTTWIGDDLRERPLGQKDAAFMLTVPMFARYMSEVTAGQELKEVPWERPAGVKATETGGTMRTTMDEVEADMEPRRPD